MTNSLPVAIGVWTLIGAVLLIGIGCDLYSKWSKRNQ